MKHQKVEWAAFMSGQYKRPSKLQVALQHVERNKAAYTVAGATVILLLSSDVLAHASTNDAVAVFAQQGPGGIDAKANAIYHNKLLGFGKWALIIKGGWGAIHKTVQEDFEGAKKTFFSYLIVYLMLLAFPWAMKEMDGMFS